jgi:tRNA A-37 threonylcarbamoyl transferase component Bud32
MDTEKIKEELLKASKRNSHEDLIRIGEQQQELINQHKIKYGDLTIDNVVVSSSNICTDTNEECKYNCSGLCKERC